MADTHDKFHSVNGKRQILVADDEMINREILGTILRNDYDIIYAEDGLETMRLVGENRETLSLVLLDLQMPGLSGMEVLKKMSLDPVLKEIPVIVATADQNSEIESLNLGAIDFISKPYPMPGVILARVLRTIELSEDRRTIESTERDPLTGLYNKEFFFSYADQYDQYHRDKEMDAIVIDVNHFHMINERYGREYADEILRRIGQKAREMVLDSGGIVCRREADTFLVYCPHGQDYKALLENASRGLVDDGSPDNRVRLRMGVYSNADKTIDVERRFDRAKMAADSVRNSFTRTIGIYDNALHERELYAEQLIEDFNRAIAEHQFLVFYQPKFNVTKETPLLSSAEALVRWQHPDLGMISPGVFIPLFEDNGLIEELDHYVWEEAAGQIAAWKEKHGISIPVSVNVSRVDMYNPGLIDHLLGIVEKHGLTVDDLYLEITESAYTQDSKQIIEMACNLRRAGFRLEMDDFGTGYSSLNMISTLPIDALKLDMQFVRNAFKGDRDTKMIEVIIDIAGHLSVPVIAEGVETEEQLLTLKSLGCDLVQGYYFSKPVPAAEFEIFIENRLISEKEEERNADRTAAYQMADIPEEETFPKNDADDRRREKAEKGGLHLRTTNFIFVIVALAAAAALFISDAMIHRGYAEMEAASDRYISAQLAARDLETGSDHLTDCVRSFVVTGEKKYMDDFLEEALVTKRRDNALAELENLLEGSDSAAYGSLSTALDYSNELMEKEYLAMKLVLVSEGTAEPDMPEILSGTSLSAEEAALQPEEMRARAVDLVFDESYMEYKNLIWDNVGDCTEELIEIAGVRLEQSSAAMDRLLWVQTLLTIVLFLVVLFQVIYISSQVRKPLTHMVEFMRRQEKAVPAGAAELRFVTKTYNEILEENLKTHAQLSYEASHDSLTGLYNRTAYEMFTKSIDHDHIALMIVDVDKFKGINDTYGHDVGDRILKKVAEILMGSFRSVDIICRIGGDEFVVIMTRANSSMRQLVRNKIAHANMLLQNPDDDLPAVSLSVGVAFSDRQNPRGDIFKDADTALYRVKEAGRCGCVIY